MYYARGHAHTDTHTLVNVYQYILYLIPHARNVCIKSKIIENALKARARITKANKPQSMCGLTRKTAETSSLSNLIK